MTRDFIAELDAAVEGRCACGCTALITAASPSAWFASEACANRWHRPGELDAALGELLCRVAAKVREAFEAVAAFIGGLSEAYVEAFRSVAEALTPYQGLLDVRESPPVPRPLDRVDPAGGLNSRPLGRPAYRPRC